MTSSHDSRITRIVLLLLCPLFLATSILAQPQSEVVCRTPGEKTENCYRFYPAKGTPRGIVFLLPMFGGDANSFESAALPKLLASRGIATVAVAPVPIYTGYFDDKPLEILDSLIVEVLARHKLEKGPFAIGGISAGATGAIRYAQRCAQGLCRTKSPAAVFGVDGPLDFERFWRAQELLLRRGSPKSEPRASQGVMGAMRRLLGGSPEEARDQYRQRSPLLVSEPEGGNAKYLKSVPLRLYTEPDVVWLMENFGSDYHTSNPIDQAAMIIQLQVLGNANAELITTTGKGYRPDGSRNPHSWSIVDEANLARWIEKHMARPN